MLTKILPIGFTDITANFTRIEPPFSISGLSEDTSLVNLISSDFIEVAEFVESDPLAVTLEGVVITLKTSSSYVSKNSSVVFQVTLSPTELVSYGSLVLRVLTPDNEFSVQNAPHTLIQTNQGYLKYDLSSPTSEILQFVVHPASSPEIPRFYITPEEYTSLPFKSNVLTLTVLPQLVELQPQPTLNSSLLSELPLHDVVVASVEKVLRTTLIDRVIDLAPTNQSPRGSSGAGIYKEMNMPSPLNASMHKKVPNDSLQRLLGMSLDQIKRLEGWATKVLHLVHSDKSLLPNSEMNLLLNLLPGSLSEPITRYSQFIEEAGKYAADISKTYATDYAQGNTIHKSNAVEQHNVRQFRVQTSSGYDVNSPSINFAAQQSVHQARFEHHAGDLYQGSHLHHFIRAEDEMTQMSANSIRYTSNQLVEYSANTNQVTGGANYYQDTEWNQVGQITQVPIHALNTKLTSLGSYGDSTKLVQNDYRLATNLGKVIFNSGTSLEGLAKTGNISFQSLAGKMELKAATGISLFSTQVNSYASGTSTSSGTGVVQVSSISNVVISGRMVLINCGGSVKVPKITSATPLVITPKVFLPLTDPAPYVKSSPVSPGQVSQNTPLTPEPASTPGGPQQLGSFLTNPNK